MLLGCFADLVLLLVRQGLLACGLRLCARVGPAWLGLRFGPWRPSMIAVDLRALVFEALGLPWALA